MLAQLVLIKVLLERPHAQLVLVALMDHSLEQLPLHLVSNVLLVRIALLVAPHLRHALLVRIALLVALHLRHVLVALTDQTLQQLTLHLVSNVKLVCIVPLVAPHLRHALLVRIVPLVAPHLRHVLLVRIAPLVALQLRHVLLDLSPQLVRPIVLHVRMVDVLTVTVLVACHQINVPGRERDSNCDLCTGFAL